MKRNTVVAILAVGIIIAAGVLLLLNQGKGDGPQGETIEFTDSRGNTVTLEYPVTGICCIGMHNAEFLNIMGMSSRVVAMDSMSLEMTYWIYGGKVRDVGDTKVPSQDVILDAGTKVILAQNSGRTIDASIASEMTRSFGIPVLYLDCYGETMFSEARALSKLFGEKASERLSGFESFYGSFDDTLRDLSGIASINKSYLYYFTSLKKFYNSNSELAKIMDSYGGHNALTDMVPTGKSVTEPLSKEVLYDYDQSKGIDLIVLRSSSGKDFSVTYSRFLSDCVFEPLKAMENHQVYVIDTDFLAGPSDIVGKICMAYSLGIADEVTAQKLLDGFRSGASVFGILISGSGLDDYVKAFGE